MSPPPSNENFPLENWLIEGEDLPASQARFTGLGDIGKSLVLSAVFKRTSRPLAVVCASRAEARNIIDNLRFVVGKDVKDRVHYIPDMEFDYYRGLLPDPELLCERNVGLFHALNDANHRIFVTTIGAILQKVVPPMEYLRATKIFSPNDEVDREELIQGLLEAGYQSQPTAYDPGIFSVRGGVIDIFCPLYPQPIRLEFFGDLIEEIRFFDPQNQRSLDKIEKACVVPVGQTLVPRNGEDYEAAAAKVKDRLDQLGIPKTDRDEMLLKLREGTVSSDLSFLFPLLSKGSSPLVEFFPNDTLFFWDGKSKTHELATEKELPQLLKNLELFEKEPFPVATRAELFLADTDLSSMMALPASYFFEDFEAPGDTPQLTSKTEKVSLESEREQSKQKSAAHPLLESFAIRFKNWMDQGYRVHVVSHTGTHAERTQMLFEPYGIKSVIHPDGGEALPILLNSDFSKLHLWQGFITESQIFPRLKLVLLSEEEIFGHKKRVAKSAGKTSVAKTAKLISAFKDIKVNDFVVHVEHGIGRYLGLKSMNFLGVNNDYVLLEYRDGDKLYIPIYRLNVLQKYSAGEGASPIIDKLGGDRWIKAKSRAQAAVAELAAEFLKIQARRKLIPAHAFSAPGADFHQFEMEFPFDETPDQMKAIDDVMADMSRPHPMDRLVCGDVGYGKTEVSLRAAYRCALDSKQAAVLVPTTVLAFQHFETFKKRFRNTPVRVEMISRLRTTAQVKKTLEELRQGKIDIVVGTHRLLSTDVQFKDLGLVVVDEEHRFGVVHKEKLKKLSESVHVLSMTATPIPRTLNMAMSGIKDVSIITTPPPDRLSVRTFVCRSSDEVIAEAISNELTRDGQVFFVHNRIETLFGIADNLKKLLPKANIEIVHGQMDGEELERKMLTFYRGEAHILLTTTIIESGLDIPRANTIIIDQANYFGLAQLYQLRGRVGRSEKRAYCYLLVPGETAMTEEAKQRLQVIQRYTDLGAGFNVASHDLEIRGAGDLLGKEQSGHLTAIGLDMYFELLEESIAELQGAEKKVEIEPEINLKIPAYFPEDYLPDIGERISLYRRLSSVENEEGISDVESEIKDRFGTLPEEVNNLLGLMKMKLHLKKLHVVRMSCGPKRTSFQFAPTTPAKPERLVKLLQANPKTYSLTPDQKLVFAVEDTDWKALLREIQRLSDQLGVEF